MAIFTALALAWTMMGTQPIQDTLEGTYECRGWNPGTPITRPVEYGGTLQLKRVGEAWAADWQTGPADHHILGNGILLNLGGTRVLSIAYMEGDQPVVATYEVSADGRKLTGVWGSDGTGHEVDTRQ
ncbi:MAG: hypothetical protein JWM80_917 [Cyanobacteria bacterium RYN_339]|nr:hypothetical protein [Cyanobacteria bacterium RYN_339]